VLQSEGLIAGTITRWEWYVSSLVTAGYMKEFTLTMSHTGVEEMAPDFETNYGGFEPAVVYSDPRQLIAAEPYRWMGFDLDQPFEYNGTDNLIIEVYWKGRDGGPSAVTYWGEKPGRICMYAGPVECDPAVFNFQHNMRATVTPTAVSPTSLGRVKAIFE
jgi:hypothetical protein